MEVPRSKHRRKQRSSRMDIFGSSKRGSKKAEELISSRFSAIDSKPPLCGYIFKSRSPSCGIGSTPIHQNNIPIGFSDGVFAQQIQQQLPWLPVAEEQDLTDRHQQQHFILLTQLVALFFNASKTAELLAFHVSVETFRVC